METSPTQVLQMQQHTQAVETHKTTNILHISGRQLWCQFCGEGTCRHFNMVHKTKIRTHWRLEQGPLLQYQIEMWLRHKNGGLIHARIHKKVLHKYKHDMMSKPQHCPYTLVPNNMAQRHRPPSQSTSPPNYHRTKYKSYNEWSEASYIMLVL